MSQSAQGLRVRVPSGIPDAQLVGRSRTVILGDSCICRHIEMSGAMLHHHLGRLSLGRASLRSTSVDPPFVSRGGTIVLPPTGTKTRVSTMTTLRHENAVCPHAPLPTLRPCPHGQQRMARGES